MIQVNSSGWQTYNAARQSEGSNISELIIVRLDSLKENYFNARLTGAKTNLIKYELAKLGYENHSCVYTCLKMSNAKGDTKKEYDAITSGYIAEIRALVKKMVKAGFGEHEFRNHEWLYDMHWYRDNDNTHYMPRVFSLAAEFELHGYRAKEDPAESIDPAHPLKPGVLYPAVRFDFQKLLVSNASLQLMVFEVSNFRKDVLDNLKGLDSYFRQCISSYTNFQAVKHTQFLLCCFCKRELYYQIIDVENAS